MDSIAPRRRYLTVLAVVAVVVVVAALAILVVIPSWFPGPCPPPPNRTLNGAIALGLAFTNETARGSDYNISWTITRACYGLEWGYLAPKVVNSTGVVATHEWSVTGATASGETIATFVAGASDWSGAVGQNLQVSELLTWHVPSILLNESYELNLTGTTPFGGSIPLT